MTLMPARPTSLFVRDKYLIYVSNWVALARQAVNTFLTIELAI